MSCGELDFLVDRAHESTSVIGARMMGGGFGGCTINLVLKTDVETGQKRQKFYPGYIIIFTGVL